jgi:hypothetical protein
MIVQHETRPVQIHWEAHSMSANEALSKLKKVQEMGVNQVQNGNL